MCSNKHIFFFAKFNISYDLVATTVNKMWYWHILFWINLSFSTVFWHGADFKKLDAFQIINARECHTLQRYNRSGPFCMHWMDTHLLGTRAFSRISSTPYRRSLRRLGDVELHQTCRFFTPCRRSLRRLGDVELHQTWSFSTPYRRSLRCLGDVKLHQTWSSSTLWRRSLRSLKDVKLYQTDTWTTIHFRAYDCSEDSRLLVILWVKFALLKMPAFSSTEAKM